MERHVVLKIQILPAKGHQLSPTQPGGGIEKNHDPFTLRYPNQKSLQFSGVLAKEKIRMQAQRFQRGSLSILKRKSQPNASTCSLWTVAVLAISRFFLRCLAWPRLRIPRAKTCFRTCL